MKLSSTQQKLQNCLGEFVTKDECPFMFIRPPKRHFGLSYGLRRFMLTFEGEQCNILYLSDLKWQSVSMYEDFCNLTKDDERFVHSDDKSVCGKNITFTFDHIHSPSLIGRELSENTFFIINTEIYKEHSFLDSIYTSKLKSVWVIRDDNQWMLLLKNEKACFFSVERVFLFDDNLDLVEEACEIKWT